MPNTNTGSRDNTSVRLLCSIAAAAALAAPRCARPTQTKLAAATADPAVASREAFDDVVQKTYGRYPVTIVRGSGCELEDDAGRTYLDFVAGISTCCLGHGDQRLVDAITKQIQEVHHVSNLYYIPNQGPWRRGSSRTRPASTRPSSATPGARPTRPPSSSP